jgi:hypothetical protein
MIKPIQKDLTFGCEWTFGQCLDYITYNNIFYKEKGTDRWGSTIYVKTIFYKKLKFFVKDIQRDSCCIELPSKKYVFSDLSTYNSDYLEVRKLMYSKDFKESSNYDSIENEGGGHIHIGLQFLKSKKEKNLFIRNMNIFSINYPELSWIFNNPFDKDNSISLLANNECMGIINNECYGDKDNGIIFNNVYNTMELRFFMMHRSLEESHLHLSLAFAIYNYLYRLTKKDTKLYMQYTDYDQFPKTYAQSCKNAFNLFNLLGLSEKEINTIKKTRFKYMKKRFEHDKYYKKRELCC